MAWNKALTLSKRADRNGPEATPPNQTQVRWLALTAGAALLPLADEMPVWLTIFSLTALLWRGWLLWRDIPLPPRWLLHLITLGSAGGVALTYHTLLGMYPGVALLVLLIALKLFETRRRADGVLVVLMAFFLTFCQYLFSQSIFTALLSLGLVWLAVNALIQLQAAQLPLRQSLKLSARLLALSLPFMLVLFFLVPRIPGPLWGLPSDAASGQSGLSEQMSPGSIGQLSQSQEIAFRVQFFSPLPDRHTLYWRGPVMDQFDGRTWRMSYPPGGTLPGAPLPYARRGETVRYEQTLEPHQRAWLLALDLPAEIPPDSWLTPQYQLVSRGPLRERKRQQLSAWPEARAGAKENARGLSPALRLPPQGNPRAHAFAADLRRQYSDDWALVQALLSHIREDGFAYTLNPPLLGGNTIDEFFFGTRKGFCEHYAGATVFILRAAGIPARIVTGYQGGEINPVDGFLEVRQSDAHAWAEVWLSDEGWRRIDPTAAIAPERIEKNLAAAVPASDPVPMLARPGLDWARQLRFRYDAVINAWNQWVLAYDGEQQRSLLQRLGLEADLTHLALWLGISLALLMAGLGLWLVRQKTTQPPEIRYWQTFLREIRRRGGDAPDWLGPAALAKRLHSRWPDQALLIEICADFQALRYQPKAPGAPSPRSLKILKRKLRRLRAQNWGPIRNKPL